jgi:hypothetical protein
MTESPSRRQTIAMCQSVCGSASSMRLKEECLRFPRSSVARTRFQGLRRKLDDEIDLTARRDAGRFEAMAPAGIQNDPVERISSGMTCTVIVEDGAELQIGTSVRQLLAAHL